MFWETSDWSLVTSGLFTIRHATVEIIGGFSLLGHSHLLTVCRSNYTQHLIWCMARIIREKKIRGTWDLSQSRRTRNGGGEGVAAVCFYRYIFTLTTVTERNMANKHLHFQTMTALCRVTLLCENCPPHHPDCNYETAKQENTWKWIWYCLINVKRESTWKSITPIMLWPRQPVVIISTIGRRMKTTKTPS